MSYCKIIFLLLIFSFFSIGCVDDINTSKTIPDNLKGRWNPYFSLVDQKNNIKQEFMVDFNDGKIKFKTRCYRNDKLYVDVYGESEVVVGEKTLTLERTISLKVPYRIKNDTVEAPSSMKDIKNFTIDKDTLFCELHFDSGEMEYDISPDSGKKILTISRPDADNLFTLTYKFVR